MRKVVAAGAILSGIGICSDEFSDLAHASVPLDHWDSDTTSSITRKKDIPFRVLSYKQENKIHKESSVIDTSIVYQVKKGDTLSHIAKRFDVPLKRIVELNDIKNPDRITIGQEIRIPVKSMTYKIAPHETLSTIAENHGVTIEEIVETNRHLLKRFPELDQKLALPYAKPEPSINVSKKSKTVRISSISNSSSTEDLPVFSWPVKDVEITSQFGMRWGRHHNGLDLVSDSDDLNIYAAKSGTVISSSYTRGGMGNLIIIDHGNGVETYYGHLSKRLVHEGDLVRAGDVIGKMGDTGNSTGVHLHFEVRKDNEPINPLKVLIKGL